MTHRKWVVLLFLLYIGVAVALWIPPGRAASADQKPNPVPQSGRYQIVQLESGSPRTYYLLDTATGPLWRLDYRDVKETGKWALVAEAPK